MTAVLAGGPCAVPSHRSAAGLWGIRSWRGDTDVTLPSSRRQRPGITWHVTNLPDDETTSLDAIPVTTVPRTRLDLAAVLDQRGVERAINEAEVRRYTDPLSLPALLDRYPRRRGTAVIRAILDGADIGATLTRSSSRLIAELDGRSVHGTAAAFERDRARDRSLNVAGWRVVRITWRQLTDEARELAQDLGVVVDGRSLCDVRHGVGAQLRRVH